MTDIDKLADEIFARMQEYTDEVEEAIPPIVDSTADAMSKEITQKAPRRTGKYAHGWKVRLLSGKASSAEGYAKLVCNPTRYRLAHLLEHGHAKRGGGRVASKPHIKPVSEKHLAEFEEKIREALKR